MRVLTLGTGRGGTSLAYGALRAHKGFVVPSDMEYRKVFKTRAIPKDMAIKLTTDHPKLTTGFLRRLMGSHSDLVVLFVIRHPLDVALSKIHRGQPGQDSIKGSADRHPDRAVEAIERKVAIREMLLEEFTNRVATVKMEDLLSNPRSTCLSICAQLVIPFQESMLQMASHNHNRFHKKRYGHRIDKTQVAVWQRWQTAYGGYFSTQEPLVRDLAERLAPIARDLGYPPAEL